MGATDPAHALYDQARKKGLIPSDARWLLRFSTRSSLEDLRRLANERAMPARLDIAEQKWHATQPMEEKPVIVHHKIDDELQTGESRKLGGALEIKAPWRTNNEQ